VSDGPASTVASARPETSEGAPADHGMRRSFRNDLAHTTGTNVAISLANLATGVLVARMLNPLGRGELAAILNWPTLLGLLTTLGLSEALVFYTARHRHRAGRYLSTALVLALAASAVFVVIGWLAMPWLLAAQSDSVVTAARWYLLQVPVAAVIGLVIGPLRGVGDVRSWNLVRATPTLVWLVTVVGFRLSGGSVSPQALALTFVGARAALVPFALWFVRWRLHGGLHPDRSLVSPLLRYGLPSAMAALPTTFNLRLDQLLIAAFLPPGDLGLYAVAVAWSLLSSPALLAFGNVLFPRVAERGDPAVAARLAARGVRVAVLLSIVLTAVVFAAAPVGLPLMFGHRFDVAVPTALVLTVAGGVVGITRVQEEALRGLGRPVSVLGAQLVSLVVTAVGLAVTVPSGGLAYIALASVAGYSVLALVLQVQLVRVTGFAPHRLLVPTVADLHSIVEQVRRPRSGRAR
jgi:O-antigen/teichoic acid export membrane protein